MTTLFGGTVTNNGAEDSMKHELNINEITCKVITVTYS